MLSVEATGKNIEQAIENALFELKAIREDVDIKILDEGGFFRKAKVEVTISSDAVEKYEKKQARVKEELEQPEGKTIEKQEIVEKIEQDDKDEEVEVIKSTTKQTSHENVSDIEKTKFFISGILAKTNLNANVDYTEKGEEIFVTINGASDLIGYRGEGLNALQYLTSVYVSKNNRHSKKIRVDCENYRARREDTLIALAHRMEKKVEKTGASVKLEPMTANERRIIHSALSESQTVSTTSKGEEPHRFLVIFPKKED